MKTKFLFFLVMMFLLSDVLPISAQTTNSTDSTVATQWVAIKESSIDSLTLSYLKQKGLISYVAPKEENNSIFISVVGYLSRLLDSSLSSISKNSNKFYETPVGFWVIWGAFYHYTGGEIMGYLLTFLYLILITILFVWLWCKHCIHRRVLVEKEILDGKEDSADILSYEIKNNSAAIQFWLLLVYFVLFFIGAIIM